MKKRMRMKMKKTNIMEVVKGSITGRKEKGVSMGKSKTWEGMDLQ